MRIDVEWAINYRRSFTRGDMTYFLAAILGLVQGITEFLPVSSDGHLVLFQQYLGPIFADAHYDHLAFDVFLHLATLLITISFCWSDVFRAVRGLIPIGPDKQAVKREFWLILRLAGLIIVASIPAGVIGLTVKDQIEASFQSVRIAGFGFLVTSFCLFLAWARYRRMNYLGGVGSAGDRPSQGGLDWPLPTYRQALLIGLAQSLALLPGISRSGTTISSALLLGLPPETALRFSFLMAIPAIAGAGLLEGATLLDTPGEQVGPFIFAFFVTMLAGWFAVRLLASVTRKGRLAFFAFYTLVLGIVVLVSQS